MKLSDINIDRFASSLKKDNNPKPIVNFCLLLFEMIACIFVIFLHINFPGILGDITEMIARFAVPFFFMISGYFLISDDKKFTYLDIRRKVKRRIIRLCVLLALSVILFFTFEIYINRNCLSTFLSNTFNLKRIIAFFFFNEPFFGGHLWFILALIYCYVFIYLFPRLFIGKNAWLCLLSAVLVINIFINIIFYQYDWKVFDIPLSHYWFYRNWLLEALPFVSLGMLLRRNTKSMMNLKNWLIITLLIASFVVMVLEGLFYRKVLHAYPIFCLFNIVFCLSIFALAIKKPLILCNCSLLRIKGKWTTVVYIIHPILITIVTSLFTVLHFEGLAAEYLKPIFVVIFSVSLSILACVLFDFCKKRRLKQIS